VSPAEAEFRSAAAGEFNRLLPLAERALDDLLRQHGRSCAPLRLRPQLRIRNIGRTAGQAHRAVVTLNAQLVGFPEEVSPTLAHELAHVVVDEARHQLGIRHRRGAWSAHGAVWRAVARQLGDADDRCHRLPLQPLRSVSRYLYRLPDGTERVLSAVRHNRLHRNRGLSYHFRGDSEPVRRRHFVARLPLHETGGQQGKQLRRERDSES
jgi:predicted SprT family Zn-dependent metalloprotease